MVKRKISLVVLLAFFCIARSEAAFMLDKVVAIVNQEVITWSELYRSMETDAMPGVKKMGEEERRKVFKENESAFLDALIDYKLQLQEARELGVRVSDEDTRSAIEGIKSKYSMNDAQFRESLKAEGYTFEEYKKRLQEQILLSKVVNQQIRNKVLVTDADVDAFLAANPTFEGSAERFHLHQIFFKQPAEASGRADVERRAGEAHAKIKNGADFGAVAREYSEDSLRETGGDLGFIDKASLAKEFTSALSNMKTGEVSAPFWTNAGLHIIRLDEKEGKRSATDLREQARRELQDRKFRERYATWIKLLRENAFIDIRL